MNILQVCAYAAPYEGNFMKSLYALDNKLSQMGHSVIYAFCEYARNKEWVIDLQKKRRVFFLPQRYARINPLTYVRLKSIIKKEKIDVVHSHFELYDLPLGVVAPKRCKMFWHLHDTIEDNYYKENAFRKMLYKLQYKTFSKNAVLCSVSKKHMRFVMTLGFDESKTLYIPNAVDFNRLIEREKNKKYDFLIFAWDYKRKGADIAIKSATQLYRDGFRFTIGFVGNEELWQNEEIKSAISEPWFIKQNFVEDISDLYNSTKCFLHISRAEGCSYAMIEAAYFGLPIISSDIEENLFLDNLPNVSYIKVDSVDRTYSAMKKMIESDFYISASDIAQTKQKINEKYSLNGWVNSIIKAYTIYGNLQ